MLLDTINAGAPASAAKLAGLCDRMAVSLDAGIDLRRAWRSEAKRSGGRLGRAAEEVADAIDHGTPLDEAMAAAGSVFPPLLVELVRVGEQTGSTPRVFRRLARHYEHSVGRTRMFRQAVAWPAIQLALALLVVGLLIGIGGVIGGPGRAVDFLGFGLTGAFGLAVYVNVVLGAALSLGLGVMALRRRPAWAAGLRKRLVRTPVVGHALQKIALARIAWALHLLLNVEIDLRRLAPTALAASNNAFYSQHSGNVAELVGRGYPLAEAFGRTRAFPPEFLNELEVAEETGMISESMERLSRRYEEEADDALAVLTRAAAGLVWLLVAGVIVLLIFRLFAFYQGVLQDALGGL
ncbi:type II secretion system F family protein [Botrimarina sp.]|uniref:type II secretion system F family protein n=1 Tax=Botrimarina sp. TaxID=2795802 RepID=UPI0032EB2C9D